MLSLDEKLSNLTLGEQDMSEIKKEVAKTAVKEAGYSVSSIFTGGITDIFVPLLEINSEIHSRIKEAKQAYLLSAYIDKVDNMEQAFEALKEMLADSYGNVILNQLFKILDGFPPERETVALLGETLKTIIDKKSYKKLFNQYQLHLRLLERISAQALYLLSRFEDFVPFHMSPAYSMVYQEATGEMVLTTPWAQHFGLSMNFNEEVISVIDELIDSHLIYAKKETEGVFSVSLTGDGARLYSYIH